MKILHSADWHLDAPMAGFTEQQQSVLRRELRRIPGKIAKLCKTENCDLLILDDLGTEVSNQFTNSCLYMVLNNRINLKRPTIINTNLSGKELKARYSDRIASRMLCEFKPFIFVGQDIRYRKNL